MLVVVEVVVAVVDCDFVCMVCVYVCQRSAMIEIVKV